MPLTSPPKSDPPLAPSDSFAPSGIFRNPLVRAGASLLLVYHLAAVLVEPLSIPPRFAGERAMLPNAVRPAFQPYMTALALEQGYKFFAPNPGNSHLVRYDLYFADGTKSVGVAEQGFPNRRRDWPRLLYHRYFMLTEHLPKDRGFDDWNLPDRPQLGPGAEMMPPVGEFVPPIADDERPLAGPIAPAEVEDRGASPEQVRHAYVQGFAAYLAKKHHAERVDLYHVVHRLSHPQEILDGRKLDMPDTYRERLLISYKVPNAKQGPAAAIDATKLELPKSGARLSQEGRR